jgi:hypothetical protein
MAGNMAVKMAVVKNLLAVKGLQVTVNFGEGGSEGLPRSGNPGNNINSGADVYFVTLLL